MKLVPGGECLHEESSQSQLVKYLQRQHFSGKCCVFYSQEKFKQKGDKNKNQQDPKKSTAMTL